ncbi:ATP-grasp domain-containing protein [Aureibaculum conchae]|uniref:ATP-grasp domain-containing protein n=1 Tax=Aureibaculum sp. 2308TA14-22 TaxID=3108392 RepID=UPI0033951347
MKKLAIIGASYLQKPLVLKAKRLGFYTICFAWEDGAVCKEICHEFYPISIIEKEKILEVCRELKIDGITSIGSDVAVTTINYVAVNLNLAGNSIQSAEISTNKYLMRTAFKNGNINIPNFIEVGTDYQLHEIESLNYPIIIKPVDRSGSKGITVLNTKSNLSKAIDYALKVSFIKKVIVEEFISGEEISVEGISFNGKHKIITFTDKVTSGFPHFVELEHHQPSKFYSTELRNEIEKTVLNGLNALKIRNGASHSELIITKDNKVYITEIGARMGGDFIGSDLVQLSTGFDYLKAVIDIAFGSNKKQDNSIQSYAGVYFYSSKSKHVKEKCIMNKEYVVECDFEDKPNDELKQSADRSGYFIYQSNFKIT